MKKVLGIVGSPRTKGNTHLLVAEFLKGAEASGASVETLLLNDKVIEECNGCHTCWKGFDCVRNDDMNGLYGKIIESDALVFGTPVYWYGPTAIIKAFLDRFVYFNCPENRKLIRGKKTALIIPFEEDSPSMASITVEMFEKSFDFLELDFKGSIIVPGVGRRGAVKAKPEALKQAFEAGRDILQ